MRAATRLYAILARRAPVAVVFRRGPSNRVLLIKWNTDSDTFEEGQWLKGKIYEGRCEISPDGELLLYFAANWRKPYLSWTAVSRPPYLTALALWPKGDARGGGGLFVNGTRIGLNHSGSKFKTGATVPKWVRVVPSSRYSGCSGS